MTNCETVYVARFWRGNPQLSNGGYYKAVKLDANSMKAARDKAIERSEHCDYGTYDFLGMYKLQQLKCGFWKVWKGRKVINVFGRFEDAMNFIKLSGSSDGGDDE